MSIFVMYKNMLNAFAFKDLQINPSQGNTPCKYNF